MKCPLAPCDEEKENHSLNVIVYLCVCNHRSEEPGTQPRSPLLSSRAALPWPGLWMLGWETESWNCGIDQEAMSHSDDSEPSSPVVLPAIV